MRLLADGSVVIDVFIIFTGVDFGAAGVWFHG